MRGRTPSVAPLPSPPPARALGTASRSRPLRRGLGGTSPRVRSHFVPPALRNSSLRVGCAPRLLAFHRPVTRAPPSPPSPLPPPYPPPPAPPDRRTRPFPVRFSLDPTPSRIPLSVPRLAARLWHAFPFYLVVARRRRSTRAKGTAASERGARTRASAPRRASRRAGCTAARVQPGRRVIHPRRGNKRTATLASCPHGAQDWIRNRTRATRAERRAPEPAAREVPRGGNSSRQNRVRARKQSDATSVPGVFATFLGPDSPLAALARPSSHAIVAGALPAPTNRKADPRPCLPPRPRKRVRPKHVERRRVRCGRSVRYGRDNRL